MLHVHIPLFYPLHPSCDMWKVQISWNLSLCFSLVRSLTKRKTKIQRFRFQEIWEYLFTFSSSNCYHSFGGPPCERSISLLFLSLAFSQSTTCERFKFLEIWTFLFLQTPLPLDHQILSYRPPWERFIGVEKNIQWWFHGCLVNYL